MNRLLIGLLIALIIIPLTMTSCVVGRRTVDRPILVEVEKEVIVERIVKLREFESLEELEEWLVTRKAGVFITFNNADCDDAAYTLQQQAMRAGFIINIQIDTRKQHTLNSVFIGNDIYFIEPQTDEVWLEGKRDRI